MKVILGITNTLSLALQKEDQDIVSAMSLVKICKKNLQLMRDNEFEELVEQASSFCYKHDITVPTMDEEYVIPGRSRRNAPMKTNYHRYCVEIFIHVIDGQLAELNDRFNEIETYCCLKINLMFMFIICVRKNFRTFTLSPLGHIILDPPLRKRKPCSLFILDVLPEEVGGLVIVAEVSEVGVPLKKVSGFGISLNKGDAIQATIREIDYDFVASRIKTACVYDIDVLGHITVVQDLETKMVDNKRLKTKCEIYFENIRREKIGVTLWGDTVGSLNEIQGYLSHIGKK
ncbi:unnamed protein product [Prunus armeniaca]